MKASFKFKIFLLSIFVIFCVLIAIFLGQKTQGNDIKTFQEISNDLSKTMNQLRDTPGITLTGFASDPSKKLFKIGVNIDQKKITSEQLKQAIELYLKNTSSIKSEYDWKSFLKPYNIRIDELSSGKLIAEKPIGATDIIWNSFDFEIK